MRLPKLGLVGGFISCLVWLSAYAQHTDESFTTTSKDCAGIHWSDEVIKRYPNVDLTKACQSVEHHDGVDYVKFSATVVRNDEGKNLTLDIKDGGEVTVAVPPRTQLSIDGHPTPMMRVRRGDKLNFYIPQSRVVAQFQAANQAPEAAPEVVAPFVPTPSPAATPAPEPQRMAAELPSTASDLPLLAFVGCLLVCLGMILTAGRRYR